jgi:transcriptional regulator with XRE-family HTH domain
MNTVCCQRFRIQVRWRLAHPEKIAEVVREVIEESGLPRTLIAEDAHLSRATLITWLAGTRTPQPETVAQLADGLERRAARLNSLVSRLRNLLAQHEK